MEIFKDIQSVRNWRKNLIYKIGFVPTMGALHQGHLSLIEKSKKTCNYTIVSIFINPLQFNNETDFNNYPLEIEKDLKLLDSMAVDAVFIPSKNILFPKASSTFVEETNLSNSFEGKDRPGHFKGVTTIVAKFFNIVQPTHAFFGEKDAQQLKIIQRMVQDLNFNIEIIPCKTVREKSGLAMSSRNENLSVENRIKAKVIKQGLDLGKIALDNGETSLSNLKKYIKSKINSEPNAKVIYVSISDSDSLIELDEINVDEILISVAVQFDNVRLIDNFTYSVS